VLCVRLGNKYGHSWAAQADAEKFLSQFRLNQWNYYMNKVLPTDRYILEKLAYEDKPLDRWFDLVRELNLDSSEFDPLVAKIVTRDKAKSTQVKRVARTLREKAMQ
jgi:hypothetical protein